MSKFDHNFSMDTQDAIEYVREKMPEFFGDVPLKCSEIGDGNINYIFRVAAQDGSKSLIIKHAESVTRSNNTATSTDRNRIEAEILQIEGELAPGSVPEIYLFDPVMCCVVMEDIGDHKNLRYALIDHETFPTLAEDLAVFMAETLIRTSDMILPPDKKKEWTKRFINPDMCSISERLVLTDPFKNSDGRNRLIPENKDFLTRELYEDKALHLEAAKLKNLFQAKAQALIHGDLHSGSVFVRPGSTKVLDPEFAYYGPIGYDVGNVMAHFIFAWANAEVTMADEAERKAFQSWVEDTMAVCLDRFAEKALAILHTDCKDLMYTTAGFAEWYVADILRDTAGYAGTEILRRVIGVAKVKDIEGITDAAARVRAERICVYAAKALIMQCDRFGKGADYVRAVYEAEKAAAQTTV